VFDSIQDIERAMSGMVRHSRGERWIALDFSGGGDAPRDAVIYRLDHVQIEYFAHGFRTFRKWREYSAPAASGDDGVEAR
jgi:hypothetical protein